MSLPDSLRVEALTSHHDRIAFCCGEASLDIYLQRMAGQDIRRRLSQVFVATTEDKPNVILGFYTLSALSIHAAELPGELARKLPKHPLPAALIGRLAVDTSVRGRSVGKYLLMDALMRITAASQSVAIYAVIVDALNDAAAAFYQKYGFQPFPRTPRRLFMPLHTLAVA